MKLTTTTQVSVDGGDAGERRHGGDMALDLVESRAFPEGMTIQVYRRAGRPQYATEHMTQVPH